MPDAADILEERAQLIAHAVRKVSGDQVWRWHEYDWHEDLQVATFEDGGTLIRFKRQTDKYAQVELSNIRPTGVLRNEKIEEIPLGRAKVVDGVTIEASNWDGLAELPISYDGRFGKTTSKEEALALGFKQNVSVEATFSQGGEAAQFKFEQKITIGSETSQETTTTTGSQESEDRGAGLSPVVPPGCDIEFHMSRTTQPTAMRVTGIGELTHGIRIGKFKDGYFSHKRGKGGKKYARSLRWSTFEDFLAALKGEAARDVELALYFRDNPPPSWLIRRLEEPLEIPYKAETPAFDGWTKLKPHQRINRGPNPVILAKLREFDDED